MPVMEEQTQKRSQRVVNNRSISVKLWTSCEPASVNNTNNIDGSLADDRFIEALLCNCYYCNLYGPASAARPGPARYTSGPARPGPWPTFFYLGPARPGPARGPPGPCRSLIQTFKLTKWIENWKSKKKLKTIAGYDYALRSTGRMWGMWEIYPNCGKLSDVWMIVESLSWQGWWGEHSKSEQCGKRKNVFYNYYLWIRGSLV